MRRESSFKRSFHTLLRIFSYGTKNVFRNLWLSIAAIAVMFVALAIILSTVILNVTTNNAIGELSKNLKVSIYLKDDTTTEQRDELQRTLLTQNYVEGVDYVSKQEAQERFSASFQDEEQLLEGLSLIGGNSLPASLEVSVRDLDKLNDVGTIAKQEQYSQIVDSITLGRTDAKQTIERAASAQHFITTASIFAAAVFTVISVLIIFNTIRIAIYTRNEEIRNMKLIGATPGFIRGPFLVETSLYGIIAGILAVSAVYSLVISLGSKIATQVEFAETYKFFTDPSTIIGSFLITIFVGILVGVFSSALAMEKYLRLKRW
jgi:cell division transport system permease protein